MALWNQKCLPAPPTNTYKSHTTDLDLVKLRNVLQDCMRHFKNEDFMTRETALLSRILYRMKMKFRSSKEFKSLEKISHSLKIYLSANIGRDLKNIFDLTPSKYQTVTYLPTRNMLNYILVRIQGLVKLMERVYDTCQVAASEINTRLFLGHFWRHYVILFALVSRLYILVKFNTKQLCELYGKLLPHVNKLKNVGRNWLPEGYSLPSDLREWLEVKWVYEEEFIDLTQDLTLHPSMQILDFFNLVDDDDDDDVQFCDEYVLIDEEDINIANEFRRLEPIEETFTRNRMRGFSINEDDIGEDIADIIKLNETSMDNIELIDMENNEHIHFHVSDTKQTSDFEDVGEDISCTVNKRDKLQVINLDETSNYHLTKDRIVTKVNNEVVQSAKECTSNSKSDMKYNKRNNITTDSFINLVDDSMIIKEKIIVIPETPLKNMQDNLNDHSVIVLNDTVNNNSVLNTTPKTTDKFSINLLDVSQELCNNGKKKKKGKSKNKKNYLKYVSSTNDNPIENVTDKRNESTNSVAFSQTLRDSNNPTSQSPSSQKAIIVQHSNAKRKITESNNYCNENDSTAKERKPDKKEISAEKSNNTKLLINQEKTLKQLNDHHCNNKDTEKISEETVEINQSIRNVTNSPNNFYCVTPVKEENICEENTFELIDKRKKGKNSNQSNWHKRKIALQQERERISPSKKNITKSLDNFISLITPIKEKSITEENNFELLANKGKNDKNIKSNQHNNKIELQQEKEKISPRTKNITKSLDNFISLITPIKEESITEEKNFEVKTLKGSNNKRKRGNNKDQHKDKIKIKQQWEKIGPRRGNNITEFQKPEENDSMVPPGIKKHIAKKSRKEHRYLEMRENERYHNEGEQKAKNIKKIKKKKKNNTPKLTVTNKANSSTWKKESIVRLTLVNEIPNVTGNQNDHAGPSNTKKKIPKNINLVPHLETPLNAILNIDSLIRASTSGETPGQNVHNMPQEMTQYKELEKKKKGKKRKAEESRDRKRQETDLRKNERHKESPSSSLVGILETVESSNRNREERNSNDERISKFFRDPGEFLLSSRHAKKPKPTPKLKKAKKTKKKARKKDRS